MIDGLVKESNFIIYVNLKDVMNKKNITVNELSRMTGVR